MQGVASIIRIKKAKPSEEVRNLFDKKTYNMSPSDSENVKHYPQKKPLFEYTGKLDDLEPKDTNYDEADIQRAIDLRIHKSKHSDFFFKLHELKERIDVYNEVFRSKRPRYLQRDTLKFQRLQQEKEVQRDFEDQDREDSPDDSYPRNNKERYHYQKKESSRLLAGKLKSLPKERSIKRISVDAPINAQSRKASGMGSVNEDPQKIKELATDEDKVSQMSKRSHANSTIPAIAKNNPSEDLSVNLPKNMGGTDQRIVTQYKQSVEKAIENQKKQEIQTNSRLHAIEKKMPALFSTSHQKSQQRGIANTKFAGSNTTSSSQIFKIQHQTLQNPDQSKKQNIDPVKSLVASQSHADFKVISLKEPKTSKGPIYNMDKSLLMVKSVYETTLFKENASSLTKRDRKSRKRNISQPKIYKLYARSQPRDLSSIIGGDIQEEALQEQPQLQDQSKTIVPYPKKLPFIQNSKIAVNIINGNISLHQSQSAANLLNNSNTGEKMKKITMLYNNLSSNQGSATRILEKIKKYKKKKVKKSMTSTGTADDKKKDDEANNENIENEEQQQEKGVEGREGQTI